MITIFKLIEPLTKVEITTLTTNNNSTFIASLYDMLGHDFAAIKMIQFLANYILHNLTIDTMPLLKDISNTPEDSIINNILQQTHTVTMIHTVTTSTPSNVKCVFNFTNDSYLTTSNNPGTLYQITIQDYKCMFGLSKIIYAIDYISGAVQSFQYLKNLLNIWTTFTLDSYPRSVTCPELIVDYFKEYLAKNNNNLLCSYELNNPISAFDGAAPYNMQKKDVFTEFILNFTYNALTIKIITGVNNHITNWIGHRFREIISKESALTSVIAELNIEQQQQLCKKRTEELNKFDELWNSKPFLNNGKDILIPEIKNMLVIYFSSEYNFIHYTDITGDTVSPTNIEKSVLTKFFGTKIGMDKGLVKGVYSIINSVFKQILLLLINENKFIRDSGLLIFASIIGVIIPAMGVLVEPIQLDGIDNTSIVCTISGDTTLIQTLNSLTAINPLNTSFFQTIGQGSGIKSKHKKTKRRQKRFFRKPERKQTRKQIKQPIQSFLPTPTKTYKRRHHKNPKQRRSRKLDPSKLDPSKLDPRAEIRRKLLLK